MSAWVNRTLVQTPRNATSTHTVAFTPATVGNLLVAIAEGSVTSTTPTGWTLPTGGSAINNTGLYVWYKTAAASEASFTTTHNAANYAVGFVVYEFAAGSTFVKSVSATGSATTAANPNLTGLTGTNTTFGVVGISDGSGNGYTSTAWSGTGTPVKDTDVGAADSGTDGYGLSVAYVDGNTATSFQPTGNATQSGTPVTKEALTFAVQVATGGTAGTVTATVSTGTGTAPTPTVSAGGTATVTPPASTAAGAAPIPAVSGATTLTGGGPATGTGAAPAPSVSALVAATVLAVAAACTSIAPAPAVQAGGAATVTTPVTTGTGQAPTPTVTAARVGTVTATTATGSSTTPAPTVQGLQAATVTATPAAGAGTAPAPFTAAGNGALIQPSPATGTVAALPPALTTGAVITTPPAAGTGTATPPRVGDITWHDISITTSIDTKRWTATIDPKRWGASL